MFRKYCFRKSRPGKQRFFFSFGAMRCRFGGMAALAVAEYASDCDVTLEGSLVSTQVDIRSPGHNSEWPLGEIPVILEVSASPAWVLEHPDIVLCSRLDDEVPTCAAVGQFEPGAIVAGPGSHRFEAYVGLSSGRRLDCHLPEHDSVDFHIGGPQVREDAGDEKNDVLVVSAADEKYYPRLANLVGSLGYWEPAMMVAIYDLGLATESRTKVAGWTNVLTIETPPDELLRTVALVNWKFWVILDAVKKAPRILWLDANFEIRRPLHDIRRALDERGYFLTVAGHRFPTEKTVRPATLDFFGCDATTASRSECTSAAVGVVRGSALHRDILPAVHNCSQEPSCLYPPDARGNTNNRRDQSALNAALCASTTTSFFCDPDRRFWMWVGQTTLLPTLDPSDTNDVVLFSRRGHGAPYTVSSGR